MVEKFRKIFKGLEERFGYHVLDQSNGNGKKSGTSFTSSYAHTEEMWKAHLEGNKFSVKTKTKVIEADSLGLCPITSDSKCTCLLYTSPSPRDGLLSRMPSSA